MKYMMVLLVAVVLAGCQGGSNEPTRPAQIKPGDPVSNYDRSEGPGPPGASTRGVSVAAFSPDNRWVLTGYDLYDEDRGLIDRSHLMTLYEVATGQPVQLFKWPKKDLPPKLNCVLVHLVAFLPDGKHVLSCDDLETIKVWDISTGAEVRRFGKGEPARIYCAALLPDGQRLLTQSFEDGKSQLKLWDVPTGRLIKAVDYRGAMRQIAITSDSKRASIWQDTESAKDSRLELWDVPSLHRIHGFPGRWGPSAFSPDGKFIISEKAVHTGPNQGDRYIELWQVASGQEVKTFPTKLWYALALTFTPDGNEVLCGDADGFLRHWDVATGQELSATKVGVICAFSADARLGLAGTSADTRGAFGGGNSFLKLQLWDLQGNKMLRSLVVPGNP